MLRYTILLLLVAFSQADQLSKLINFVRGNGANPSGTGSGAATLSSAPPPRVAAPPVGLAAPIPFSEPADPSRGRVQIDVPQPNRSSPQVIKLFIFFQISLFSLKAFHLSSNPMT